MGLWIFLAAATVASLAFVSIIIWVEAQRKERQEYYRFEFRKRLVEGGDMDAGAFAALLRYEHELGLRQAREKLLVAGFIFIGIGVGTCFGLRFIDNAVWMVGYIPLGVGLGMLLNGFFFAAKPNPEPPATAWNPESGEKG